MRSSFASVGFASTSKPVQLKKLSRRIVLDWNSPLWAPHSTKNPLRLHLRRFWASLGFKLWSQNNQCVKYSVKLRMQKYCHATLTDKRTCDDVILAGSKSFKKQLKKTLASRQSVENWNSRDLTSNGTDVITFFRLRLVAYITSLHGNAWHCYIGRLLSKGKMVTFISQPGKTNEYFGTKLGNRDYVGKIYKYRYTPNMMQIGFDLLPAPLLLLSFTLKLSIVTLFYSIYLLHKRIVFN